MSLSGSCEFLASSLFKVGSSSPFWSVHGIFLQVSRIDVAPLEIGFDRVLVPQFWSFLVSFAGLEFSVHQASRHPTLLHSNHVSNQSKLGLDDGGLYAGELNLIEDFQIGNMVLPPDFQDGAESSQRLVYHKNQPTNQLTLSLSLSVGWAYIIHRLDYCR